MSPKKAREKADPVERRRANLLAAWSSFSAEAEEGQFLNVVSNKKVKGGSKNYIYDNRGLAASLKAKDASKRVGREALTSAIAMLRKEGEPALGGDASIDEKKFAKEVKAKKAKAGKKAVARKVPEKKRAASPEKKRSASPKKKSPSAKKRA